MYFTVHFSGVLLYQTEKIKNTLISYMCNGATTRHTRVILRKMLLSKHDNFNKKFKQQQQQK